MRKRRQNELEAVAVLDDPVRRKIFDAVRRARHALSREDVAKKVGISSKLAAFHLDKIEAKGLLKSHYARPAGRGGPGAGRSAKYYEPSDVEVGISIPERHYDLAGELLLQAVRSHAGDETASDAALRIARERGLAVGSTERKAKSLKAPGAQRALAAAERILDDYGYEPYRERPGVVALKNCPFHSFAQNAPELMCTMNQAFIDGVLRGLGNTTVEAELMCNPGDCCVTLHRREN